MGCPLTLAYLDEARTGLLVKNSLMAIFGDLIEQLDNLKERAQSAPGSQECQHLRAFYAVEVMYSELVRKALNEDKLLTRYAGSQVALAPVVTRLTEPLPRSWEGLGKLIERVDDIDGEVTMQLTEIAFAKKAQFGEREEVMLEDRFKKTLKVFEICAAAAKVLRRSLGNDDVDLSLIGKGMGRSVFILDVPYHERINYGLNLLNITPTNPVTPWPTKTESQE